MCKIVQKSNTFAAVNISETIYFVNSVKLIKVLQNIKTPVITSDA